MSLLSRTFPSDIDFEDDGFSPIPRILTDEPFYYAGISDEELHFNLNREFEEKVNWIKYGILFSSDNLLHDNGGEYILCEPYNGGQIVDRFGDCYGCVEGIHHVGEDDFVEKQYIKPKPISVFDSMLKMFKKENLWIKNVSY